MIKIAINGFGRIGRLAFRIINEREGIEVVAINDVLPAEHIAYLLKFDSVHGRFKGDVRVENNSLIVDSKKIQIVAERDPSKLDWKSLNIDFVIEATGLFTSKEKASLHLKAGAKKVVISGPSDDVKMFVMGVNHHQLKASDKLFSNATCTTNCLAPIAKVLNEKFGIVEGLMTTIHAVTASQKTVDGASEKWRRGRSALNNIIPTTTEAAKAIVKIMPELEGKFLSNAFRVPIVNVSLLDIDVRLKKSTTISEISKAMKVASENELKGILGYTEDKVVSQDFVSETCTSVFDATASMQLNNNFFKIIAWYDNEYGYATKIVDLVEYSASL